MLLLCHNPDLGLQIDQDKAFPGQRMYLQNFPPKSSKSVAALENILSAILFINFSWSRMTPTAIRNYFHKIAWAYF